MICIYKITSPIGKIYVGQTINYQRRLSDYKRIERIVSQKRLFNSFNKYGVDKHIFEVIEECCEGQLNNLERYWQDFYNVLGRKGLNCKLTSTNDKTGYLSEQTKKLLSEKARQRVFTSEDRKRMSEGQKGKKRSKLAIDKISKKVECHSLKDNSIKKYRSISEASRDTGVNKSSISLCCNGKISKTKGYVFYFLTTESV